MRTLSALTLIAGSSVVSALQPMPTWSNGAVLQSTDDGGEAASVYGHGCTPSTTVTVVIDGKTQTTKANPTGSFIIKVPHSSGGPFKAQLSCDGTTNSLNELYFGDVFICSGQSNMVYPLQGVDNSTILIKESDNYGYMRLFQVPTLTGIFPEPVKRSKPVDTFPDVIQQQLQWKTVNSTNIPDFSAVCYLSALQVSKSRTGTRPIGLIQSAMGGTPVEGWCTTEGLERCSVGTDQPIPQQSGGLINNGSAASGDFTWNFPGTLYNQMMSPLVGTTVRSFMWYQGEANMNEGYHLTRLNYGCLFRSMIEGWRSAWGQVTGTNVDIPFNFVQLHSCDRDNNGQCFSDFCNYGDIRMAEDDVRRFLKNTGMAVSYDQGHSGIHSPHKAPLGVRLGGQILKSAYAAGNNPDGPLVQSACVSQLPTKTANGYVAEVTIKLSNNDNLRLQPTEECEQLSPDCCTGKAAGLNGVALGLGQMATGVVWTGDNWFDSAIRIEDGNLILSANVGTDSKTPTVPIWEVRYAHGAFPSCALVNNNSVPIRPFGRLAVSPLCQLSDEL
eukprot:TRINITY_DN2097_c0_g1_i2.p1 TRINITY_DN2097_c0_g1~~TRINITY_DN2097_c0_g1_i2.p1  ORF type:complete len:556 (+),score=133.62 TRINITY_DN2097_c0_g1_i2:120-1787(+)